MPDLQEAAGMLLELPARGPEAVAALAKQLNFDIAYDLQLEVLRRRIGSGQHLVGWKIGFSSPPVRSRFGLAEPVYGPLLAARHYRSGHAFDWSAMTKPQVEAEICFRLARPLSGSVTRDEVAAAIADVRPSFEIVEGRLDPVGDLPLYVADDVGTFAIVTGEPVQLDALDLADVHCSLTADGEQVVEAISRDAVDDHLAGIAWLAGALARRGQSLEAGLSIITGSFHKPVPAEKGQLFTAVFSGIGEVSARFD